jgi:hypothetical protein
MTNAKFWKNWLTFARKIGQIFQNFPRIVISAHNCNNHGRKFGQCWPNLGSVMSHPWNRFGICRKM